MIRVATAIILGLIVLGIIWLLPSWCVNILIIVVAALGLLEFGKMFFKEGTERFAAFAVGIITAAVMVFFRGQPEVLLLILSLDLFILALVFMSRAEDLTGVAGRLALAMTGVVYLGISFPFWSWIGSLSHGKELLLIALVPACFCDTFALVAGKSFGKHKMAPRVSPNKTLEGLLGAMVGSLVGIFLMRWLLWPSMPVSDALLLSLVIWVTSPFGDLVESFFKRSSGVKDSGSIIPGHGGVLDRLDALVFTGPAAFAYFKYVMNL